MTVELRLTVPPEYVRNIGLTAIDWKMYMEDFAINPDLIEYSSFDLQKYQLFINDKELCL